MNKIIAIVCFLVLFSCTKESETEGPIVLENNGTVWLSGGLMYCATQFRMDTGDTLIPTPFAYEWVYLKSGERIHLKYSILEERESGCTIGKDCRVIEIAKIQ